MRWYHTTFAVEAILRRGFRDNTGTYMTGEARTGVWFSDRPLDIGAGAKGDFTLCLSLPAKLFRAHEWVEEERPFRESLIPARLVNSYGPPVIIDGDWINWTRQQIATFLARGESLGGYAAKRSARLSELLHFLESRNLIDEGNGINLPKPLPLCRVKRRPVATRSPHLRKQDYGLLRHWCARD